jgi:hypothetical protein
MDADFSAQFIKQMHLLGTPNFSTAHCYDRLIGDHIGNVVFSLTQAEARNYGKWPVTPTPNQHTEHSLGRFLRRILEDLTIWALNEATFKQENEDKKGARLPGLRVKTGGEESFMTHSMLNNFFQKLHKKLWHVSPATRLPSTTDCFVVTCRMPHVERVYAQLQRSPGPEGAPTCVPAKRRSSKGRACRSLPRRAGRAGTRP